MFKEWKEIVCRPLKILDVIIGILVIGTTLFLIFYWKHIPEKVPQHWNAVGEIDDYADAGSYLLLIMLMYFFYAWHSLTKLLPIFGCRENIFGKALADKVSKKEENKALNALFAMLWCCDLLCEIAVAYIILCGIFLKNLGAWFLPFVFGALAVIFIWFFIRMNQIKKEAAVSSKSFHNPF